MNKPSTAAPGQGPQATPPQQQAQVQNPPAPQPAIIPGGITPGPETPPQEQPPTPEQVAQWRAQAEQANALQQQLAQQDQNYRHLQAEFTRRAQAEAQMRQQQQPPPQAQDPLAGYQQQIEALKAKGYDDAAARDTVGLFAGMLTPLQQQNQQLQAALQGGLQVDQVMQQVYGTNPQLFANQAVFQQTREALLAQAIRGGVIDVRQAGMTAAALNFEASLQQQQQPQGFPLNVAPFPPQAPQAPMAYPPQVQQPIPQPFANGQFRVTPAYTQPPPSGVALTPDQQQAENFLSQKFNLQPPKTA